MQIFFSLIIFSQWLKNEEIKWEKERGCWSFTREGNVKSLSKKVINRGNVVELVVTLSECWGSLELYWSARLSAFFQPGSAAWGDKKEGREKKVYGLERNELWWHLTVVLRNTWKNCKLLLRQKILLDAPLMYILGKHFSGFEKLALNLRTKLRLKKIFFSLGKISVFRVPWRKQNKAVENDIN